MNDLSSIVIKERTTYSIITLFVRVQETLYSNISIHIIMWPGIFMSGGNHVLMITLRYNVFTHCRYSIGHTHLKMNVMGAL